MPSSSTSLAPSLATLSPAVDAYIEKAAPFAQPVLQHLREVVHAAVPDVEETLKWSMPFFLYKGIILAHIAAFKAHCSFDVWKEDLQPTARSSEASSGGSGERSSERGMGSFGKLTSLKDLPADRTLKAMLVAAAGKIDRGERTKNWNGRAKKDRPAPEVPQALAAALEKHGGAAARFEAMSPSCRREYCDWIAEAKRVDTRTRRIEQAVAMFAEGKGRNWKYETC